MPDSVEAEPMVCTPFIDQSGGHTLPIVPNANQKVNVTFRTLPTV